ncbi:MFS transporter [Actinokineospora terrae]|uniref:Predicted arabinose efflux permease, MFS family n=1 Tax=Actinokineospora terrae TaxID=155974 RepID=A0A1H9VDH7_9PSEU|nr:MFS transporter [Actinokineospora terrae]SES19619.1 Predicted arabinose efflux permease, MFS family [Actinokineospora terrae]
MTTDTVATPRLRAYVAAASLARVADEMVAVAVVLLVLDRTSSPALAGATVTAHTLPSIVSGPVLGAWLDRVPYRRAVLSAGGVLLALTCAGLVLTVGRVPVVPFVLAALTGLALPLTSGGYSSLVPKLVPAERLPRANALDAATFNIGAIAGPALAGTVAAVANPAAAVWLIAVLALSGSVCTLFLPPVTGVSDDHHTSLLRTVRAGLTHLVHTPALRGATLTTVIGYGSVGVLATALPLRMQELGQDRAAAGYVWTAMEIGCLVAVVVLGRFIAGPHPQVTVVVSTAAFGALMLCWPIVDSVTWTLAFAVAAGLAEGLALPAIMATRQRHTPSALLAQVSTTGASLKIGTFSLGAAAGGWLVPAAGPATAITVTAGLQLLAAALGVLAGVRRARPAGVC